MKNRVRWIIMLMVVALVSSSAWAVWNPNSDVKFNLDFTTYNNTSTPPTTTDAKLGLIGDVVDYNTAGGATGKDIFETTGGKAGLGDDANFMPVHDHDTSTPNDVKIMIPNDGYGNPVFNFGLAPVTRTFSFWFKASRIDNGTMLRHQYYDSASQPDKWWEIRMYGGKMSFFLKPSPNILRFETVSTLSALGLTANTWHHASVIVDRTAMNRSKIYIDGADAPVLFTVQNLTYDANVDPGFESPLKVGAGERKFDGCLDEVRIYHRSLNALEASILYQTDGLVHPMALLPIPKVSNVAISTDANWVKAAGATSQKIYFGTDAGALNLVKTDGAGTVQTLTNAEMGGPLELSTTYYWAVDSNIGGTYADGPTWSFTTETGKAINPTPTNGKTFVPVGDVNLMWDEPTTHPSSYSVYLSTSKTLVEANDPTVRVLDAVDANDVKVNIALRGTDMYWRVISNYPSAAITGDTWQFRMRPYEIIFSTKDKLMRYEDHNFPPYSAQIHGNTWTTMKADGNSTLYPTEQDVIGHVGTDGTLIFDFNTFVFDNRFEIVVIPAYRNSDCNSTEVPRPIAIHVNNGGNFDFDGRMDISGDDIVTGGDLPKARCGGFPGAAKNQGNAARDANFLNVSLASGTHSRYGNTGAKLIYCPNSNAVNPFFGADAVHQIYGKGMGLTLLEKGGSGAGYGGNGGEGARAYYLGMHGGGATYGDEEVPVPFGGSAGGWTDQQPGCPGGGGVEIVAANVTLGSNSAIMADAGASLASSESTKGCGGGAGGSVKIIATGNVVANGSISANGSNGGNCINGSANNTGGGGAGGRVAIFYGGTISPALGGNITVNGGLRGFNTDGTTIAKNGQAGTKFTSNGSPKKASAPTPADGDEKVYAASGGTALTLKWYSGYGATTDVVYFGTVNPPTTAIGSSVSATRGQHSATATVNIVPDKTYYFQVKSDGAVDSDVWTFKTVSWICPLYKVGGTTHVNYTCSEGVQNSSTLGIGGPEWDINGDCIVNDKDFWYFANDWLNPEFGVTSSYYLSLGDLGKYAAEWLVAEGRQ